MCGVLQARLAETQEQLAAVKARLAEALLRRAPAGGGGDVPEDVAGLQRRVAELEAALVAAGGASGSLRSHMLEPAGASGPFSTAAPESGAHFCLTAPTHEGPVLQPHTTSGLRAGPSTPVRGGSDSNPLASPRPAAHGTPGMAAAQSGLMSQLASVQQDLRKKEEQVARLARERAASGVKAQYDRLVADMARQQSTLKEQQQALRAKLKAVDVRAGLCCAVVFASVCGGGGERGVRGCRRRTARRCGARRRSGGGSCAT